MTCLPREPGRMSGILLVGVVTCARQPGFAHRRCPDVRHLLRTEMNVAFSPVPLMRLSCGRPQ